MPAMVFTRGANVDGTEQPSDRIQIDSRMSARRSAKDDRPEDNYDARDFLIPSISVGEIFVAAGSALTGEGSLYHGDLGLNLKRKSDISVRIYAGGGVGYAPPPSLVDSKLWDERAPFEVECAVKARLRREEKDREGAARG